MKSARHERIKDLVLSFVLLIVGVAGFLFINPTGTEVVDGPGGLSFRTLPFVEFGALIFLVLLYVAASLLIFGCCRRGVRRGRSLELVRRFSTIRAPISAA